MNKIKYILYITGVLASYDGHSQPTKPNIIVINCDDMGYGDLSCFGSPTIKTPNIDRMAKDKNGVVFTFQHQSPLLAVPDY